MEKRPRDEQGRFMESSELEEKMTGARLHKGYGDKLNQIAKKLNMSKTELVRQILEDYVNNSEPK
ncbi:MAG: ribbon-helix-helix protein, CopG family [Cyanobacteria bacterium P01_A01_bin.40]